MLRDRDAKVRLAAIKALIAFENGPAERGCSRLLMMSRPKTGRQPSGACILVAKVSTLGFPPCYGSKAKTTIPRCMTRFGTYGPSKVLKPPHVTADLVPVLIASLQSRDRNVRCLAADLLAEFRAFANAAIPELLHVLNEPLAPGEETAWHGRGNSDPASRAIWALKRIAPGTAQAKKVIAALIEVVRSGPRSRRAWAASALASFGTDAAEAAPF